MPPKMLKHGSFSKPQMPAKPFRCLISQYPWSSAHARITVAAHLTQASPEDPVFINAIVVLVLLELLVRQILTSVKRFHVYEVVASMK